MQHASVQDAVHECTDAFRTEATRQAAITALAKSGSMHKAQQACVTVSLRNSCRLPTTDHHEGHSLTSAATPVEEMTALMQNNHKTTDFRRQDLTGSCTCVYRGVLGACVQSSLDSFHCTAFQYTVVRVNLINIQYIYFSVDGTRSPGS